MAASKPNGLAFKLAEVMGAISHVSKAGFNATQKYAYAKESDVAEAVRGLLADRHIWVWSSTDSSETTPLYTTSSGNTMWLTRVRIGYCFIDGDTGESTEVQYYEGQGADTGDKALPKAQSMALKYFLLKSFLMSTGVDDAEGDEKVDRSVAAAGAAKGAKIAKGTIPGERGGKSTMTTEAQINEIARRVRDLNLGGDEFVAAAEATTGIKRDEGMSIRDYLSSLTSEQSGKVIILLSEMKPRGDDEQSDPVMA